MIVLSGKKIEAIRAILKEELQKIPEFDVERAYDESYRYERIKLSSGILEQVIFDEKKDLSVFFSLCCHDSRLLSVFLFRCSSGVNDGSGQ